jgi:hypothetical protein
MVVAQSLQIFVFGLTESVFCCQTIVVGLTQKLPVGGPKRGDQARLWSADVAAANQQG